jgi:hypothetical protein
MDIEPETQRVPESPRVDKQVNILVISPKDVMSAQHKDYGSYQEFWNDSCWGGPIDWNVKT